MKVEPGCKALAQDVVLLLTLGVSNDSLNLAEQGNQAWLINSPKALRRIHEAGFAYCPDQYGCTFEEWR